MKINLTCYGTALHFNSSTTREDRKMYIKVTQLTKFAAEVECVDSDGYHISETVSYAEARDLAVDMMSAAKKILELVENK